MTIWLSAGLLVLTLFTFRDVHRFGFVTWDDPYYVVDNNVVRQGLSWDGVRWAFTRIGGFYWHPLTWISHMTDVELFGIDASVHHVVNLALHALGTLLLFGVASAMTGRPERSALIAALFAVHPLHVESVAWVSERKDVLAGVFWMLTLSAYARYVRAPSGGRYAAIVACFVLGLLSKPTLVTLPLVLLVLDVWPLGRAQWADLLWPRRHLAGRLVLEKAPLLALSAAASIATIASGSRVGALQDLAAVPPAERLSNGIASTVRYLALTFWPTGLAAFYPFRPIPGSHIVWSLAILAGVTCAAVRLRTRRPYLLAGWLWFLVTLLPVIGLVQAGSQSMADRFTYLPMIGIAFAAVWSVADILCRFHVHRMATWGMAVAVVAACSVAAHEQARYWTNSEMLWQRAVDAVPNNDLAHANLGLVLAGAGRSAEALQHFLEAIRIVHTADPATGTGRGAPPPEYAAVLHGQAGFLLARDARWDEAIPHLREVVRVQPHSADAHFALAQALSSSGDLTGAVDEYRAAIGLDSHRAEFHGGFSSALYRQGDRTAAIMELRDAIRLAPSHDSAAKWHFNLAAMLNEEGRSEEAIRELEAALAIDPMLQNAREALEGLRKSRREER